jgi:hypothetical protein
MSFDKSLINALLTSETCKDYNTEANLENADVTELQDRQKFIPQDDSNQVRLLSKFLLDFNLF